MSRIFSYEEPKIATNENEFKMDFSNLIGENSISLIDYPIKEEIPTTKRKSKSSSKKDTTKTKKLSDGSEIVLAESETTAELSVLQTNEPYSNSYNETNSMLKSAILQTDVMNTEIRSDLDSIRSSKTLKKKYDYIALLSGTSATLLGTKVNAIKELNKTINDCHNLELKRVKELKLTENEKDDDKQIMDMYNAFISTPIGTNMSSNSASFIPSPSEITMSSMPGIVKVGDIGSTDAGYLNYVNNLTPAQNMMRYENNPNIETVVVYDQSTGKRWFDVIDMQTGQSVPNSDKPDQMFLEDTTIDTRNGIARNTNLDKTYKLMVVGSAIAMEY